MGKITHCWPKNICIWTLPTSHNDNFKSANIANYMYPAMFNTFSALFNLVGAAFGPKS